MCGFRFIIYLTLLVLLLSDQAAFVSAKSQSAPTASPSVHHPPPFGARTVCPSHAPTATAKPTVTKKPTMFPTRKPTSTAEPSSEPSSSGMPSAEPITSPTSSPSSMPSSMPSPHGVAGENWWWVVETITDLTFNSKEPYTIHSRQLLLQIVTGIFESIVESSLTKEQYGEISIFVKETGDTGNDDDAFWFDDDYSYSYVYAYYEVPALDSRGGGDVGIQNSNRNQKRRIFNSAAVSSARSTIEARKVAVQAQSAAFYESLSLSPSTTTTTLSSAVSAVAEQGQIIVSSVRRSLFSMSTSLRGVPAAASSSSSSSSSVTSARYDSIAEVTSDEGNNSIKGNGFDNNRYDNTDNYNNNFRANANTDDHNNGTDVDDNSAIDNDDDDAADNNDNNDNSNDNGSDDSSSSGAVLTYNVKYWCNNYTVVQLALGALYSAQNDTDIIMSALQEQDVYEVVSTDIIYIDRYIASSPPPVKIDKPFNEKKIAFIIFVVIILYIGVVSCGKCYQSHARRVPQYYAAEEEGHCCGMLRGVFRMWYEILSMTVSDVSQWCHRVSARMRNRGGFDLSLLSTTEDEDEFYRNKSTNALSRLRAEEKDDESVGFDRNDALDVRYDRNVRKEYLEEEEEESAGGGGGGSGCGVNITGEVEMNTRSPIHEDVVIITPSLPLVSLSTTAESNRSQVSSKFGGNNIDTSLDLRISSSGGATSTSTGTGHIHIQQQDNELRSHIETSPPLFVAHTAASAAISSEGTSKDGIMSSSSSSVLSIEELQQQRPLSPLPPPPANAPSPSY